MTVGIPADLDTQLRSPAWYEFLGYDPTWAAIAAFNYVINNPSPAAAIAGTGGGAAGQANTVMPLPGTSPADQSAKAIINGALAQYGLESLSNTVWSWYLSGRPVEQIMLDIRGTPEYKARFPAMETLAKEGRAISESQYIDYERGVANIMQAAGLPAGFYDQPSDFANFLTNNVALPELQDRINLYTQITFQQPKEVRDELQQLFGVNPGDMVAYFIDPTRALPLITQRVRAATAAGMSLIAGYGQLSQEEALRVGALAPEPGQELQGFSQLAQMGQIFNPLAGRAGTAINRSQQLGAIFGQEGMDIQAIEQRRRELLAEYQGGGGYAGGQRGVAGIGPAT